MGIEPCNPDNSEKRADRINGLYEKIENTREKMEAEVRTFIEATKKFSFEWIQREMNSHQREMNSNVSQMKSEACTGNVEIDRDRVSKLLCPEDLSHRIQDIVEEHLNRDDYWVHRSGLRYADISHDYIGFKKEKALEGLTSSIRMILGCAAEIFADVKDENSEEKVWVKERGRRKYICILRFSDEMTASLDRYFSMLEELFALEYEISKMIEKEAEKGKEK
ncbi:hypothetical protein RSJ42_16955 [Methanosarcina hadiensis]|uniref:hypothetical protein n=1 Tax=Methanosarcina hadiensis TaxID=3078083 RepID=UPI0039775B85